MLKLFNNQKELKMSKNAECPCGSGEKYKKCCRGKISAEHEAYYAILSMQSTVKQKLLWWINKNLSEEEMNQYAKQFNGTTLKECLSEKNFIWFYEWLFTEAELHGKNFVYYILSIDPQLFTPVETNYLNQWVDNIIPGFFEIIKTNPAEWNVSIRDIFNKKEYLITDRKASEKMVVGDIIFSRVDKYNSKNFISGILYTYPPRMEDELIAFIEQKKKTFGKTYEELMKTNSKIIHEFEPKKPKLINFSGDELLFCEKEYEFDLNKIDSILDYFSDEKKFMINELKYPKSGFKEALISILETKKPTKQEQGLRMNFDIVTPYGETHPTKGEITLKGNKMKLFTNSKERLEYATKLISKTKFFRQMKEQITNPWDNIPNKEKTNTKKEKTQISPKEKKRIKTQFLEKYYTDWVDITVPALGNITPREALKTIEGKKLLKKLLSDFENREEHERREGKLDFEATKLIRKKLEFYE